MMATAATRASRTYIVLLLEEVAIPAVVCTEGLLARILATTSAVALV
jgi:hypothetical protein